MILKGPFMGIHSLSEYVFAASYLVQIVKPGQVYYVNFVSLMI
jgi:hypothetical protein